MQDVVIDGDFAYIAGWDSGLHIIDISDPADPTEVGFVGIAKWARAVAKVGDYAYVAASEGGLRIIDVSVPSTPVEVGFFDTSGYAYDVAVDGSFAFLAEKL